MSVFRLIKYKYLLKRRRRYASLAMGIALAHASFGQVKYKSVGNGMADIELSLEQDQRFRLNLNSVEENKAYALKGKWKVDQDSILLEFKRPRIDVNTLFAANSGFVSSNRIEDEKTVRISQSSGGLMIYGIYCPKELT